MMHTRQPHSRGLTLVEMMIVVTIIGILSAAALPQYQQYVERGRRVEAGSALMDAAQFMQKIMDSNNGAYQVGNAPPVLPLSMQTSPPNATGTKVVYNITVATPTPNTFVLTATPRVGGLMTNDPCGSLTLDQRGRKGNSGTIKTLQTCWK
jgi:type IV pilus assembly protein PilE